jgi:hypothetical protein
MHSPDKKVSVIAVRDMESGTYLCIHRSPSPDDPSGHDWALITETYEPEMDSDLHDCASRGLKEELSIHIAPSNFRHVSTHTKEDVVCGYFFLPIWGRSDLTVRYQLEEVVDHDWLTPKRFMSRLKGSPFKREASSFILSVEYLCSM